ncbi:MAG: serine/threonine protein phosphatase, partial [Ruminococcus sp.]|nr:serine/threonine protein phosphatase [Ruminococcus sp.]
GDVDIKVIGAENQLFDTNIPVRQLIEQIIAKLSIPPFLLGLNWNTTERMSSQQADILTSELEYYRRLLTPVICGIGNSFICSIGADAVCSVEWDNINLQDESVLAEARLKNAQAREIEIRLENLN